MSQTFRREQIGDGVYFSSVTDPKFKHNRITINLITELKKESATSQALLPFVLRRGSKSCPDFTELNRRLANLYGAALSCDVGKSGGYQALDLSIYAIDNRFALDGENVIEQCAALLLEILMNPKVENGAFDEQDVELEKQQLRDLIESQINDKRTYALNRCRAIMCGDEPVAIEKYGYIEDLDKITPQSLVAAYKTVLSTAQLEISFVGCGNADAAKEIFKGAFGSQSRSAISAKRSFSRPKAGEERRVTDEMDVAQSKLVLGLRTGERKTDKEIFATRLCCAVYGGTPNSRLFTYVREKKSLCYYCAARYDRLTGLLMVDSGVEKANAEVAIEEILYQLDVMQTGKFTDEEFAAAKLLMSTQFDTVSDSLGSLESWYLTQTMNGTAYTPQQERDMMNAVTREEVAEAARAITLDTIYFLTGKEAQ